jgi:hypothetical protein
MVHILRQKIAGTIHMRAARQPPMMRAFAAAIKTGSAFSAGL